MLNKENVMEYLRGLIEIRKNLINAIKANSSLYDIAVEWHNQSIEFDDGYSEKLDFFMNLANGLRQIRVDTLVFKYLDNFEVKPNAWSEYSSICSVEIDGFTIISYPTWTELEMWGVDIDGKRVS